MAHIHIKFQYYFTVAQEIYNWKNCIFILCLTKKSLGTREMFKFIADDKLILLKLRIEKNCIHCN